MKVFHRKAEARTQVDLIIALDDDKRAGLPVHLSSRGLASLLFPMPLYCPYVFGVERSFVIDGSCQYTIH